jgi:hypothetical protein
MNGRGSSVSCERSEAIQLAVQRKKLDCFAPLAMTLIEHAMHHHPRRSCAPDGQITKTCPAPSEKIFRLTRRANQFYRLARLTRQEGRIAIVTNAGWDAVDAAASARKVTAGRILDP